MAELGTLSVPLELRLFAEPANTAGASPTPPVELARQHAASFDRARHRLRGKLRNLGELFGEMIFRALELPVEDLEENGAEAFHHYERAIEQAAHRIVELERERNLLGDELSTFRSELRDAVAELDRRNKRARREPDALVLHLHEILAGPVR